MIVGGLPGGADVAADSGFVFAAGTASTTPSELHPDRVLTNAGLRDGDALVLTKALGVGVATTAIKLGTARPELVPARSPRQRARLCSAPETYTHLVGVPVFKTGERR